MIPKFRGKSKVTGEWFYGDLLTEYDRYAIAYDTNILDGFASVMRSVEVFPETVGQYTGVKDKNENEIYSNSHIIYDAPKKHGHLRKKRKVYFDDGSFQFEDSNGFVLNNENMRYKHGYVVAEE